jgi:hypothetical protein
VPSVVPPQPWLRLQAAVDPEVFAAFYASVDSRAGLQAAEKCLCDSGDSALVLYSLHASAKEIRVLCVDHLRLIRMTRK